MKIELDKNGWTVHATELDPRSVTDQELEILRTVPYTNVLLVIHDLPSLTADQYHEFCHKVFESVQNDNPTLEKRFLPGHDREILRVTGRKNEQGEIIGVFGMPEFLPWHCNQPGIPLDQRPDCLTLYSVEHCKGSVTAFTNSVMALQDLRQTTNAPDGLVDALDHIEAYYKYIVDLDQKADEFDYVGYTGRNKLVVKNKSNQQGILFGNAQIESFWINNEQVPDYLYQTWQSYLGKFLTQKKYVYAHRWQDNEMIMNCQVLGQHARLPFASIEKRLLWRIMGRVESFDGSALTV
jgi:hypothetical protein